MNSLTNVASFFPTDHKSSEKRCHARHKIKFKIDNCLIMVLDDAICMRKANYADGRKTGTPVTRIDEKPMLDFRDR